MLSHLGLDDDLLLVQSEVCVLAQPYPRPVSTVTRGPFVPYLFYRGLHTFIAPAVITLGLYLFLFSPPSRVQTNILTGALPCRLPEVSQLV